MIPSAALGCASSTASCWIGTNASLTAVGGLVGERSSFRPHAQTQHAITGNNASLITESRLIIQIHLFLLFRKLEASNVRIRKLPEHFFGEWCEIRSGCLVIHAPSNYLWKISPTEDATRFVTSDPIRIETADRRVSSKRSEIPPPPSLSQGVR
ncbi:hypothetical protein BH11MYX2_BH11MYX2_25080 [soil metagenome]